MLGRDLILWRFGRAPVRSQRSVERLMDEMQPDMNRIFDDFWRRFDLPTLGWLERAERAPSPDIDISEDDKEVRITAELPGVDETDVEVLLADQVLTIRGEKKAAREKKEKNHHLVERTYGSFERSIHIGSEVDEKRIKASFDKGVLTVTLPKTAKAKEKYRRIPIKNG